MSDPKRIYPINRPVRKILITIPRDQVKMIDECAGTIGMSRSAFLQVYFDIFAERVRDFTEGWLGNMKYYYKEEAQSRTT